MNFKIYTYLFICIQGCLSFFYLLCKHPTHNSLALVERLEAHQTSRQRVDKSADCDNLQLAPHYRPPPHTLTDLGTVGVANQVWVVYGNFVLVGDEFPHAYISGEVNHADRDHNQNPPHSQSRDLR